jgi:hypothetical protein
MSIAEAGCVVGYFSTPFQVDPQPVRGLLKLGDPRRMENTVLSFLGRYGINRCVGYNSEKSGLIIGPLLSLFPRESSIVNLP